MLFVKKRLICKKKAGTVTKGKLVTKIKKLNQSASFWNFGIVIVEITHKIGLLSKIWL